MKPCDGTVWLLNMAMSVLMPISAFFMPKVTVSKKNKNRAVQYYIMGAEKGDPYAQYLLGRAYEQGRGIKYSPERSLYWLEKAAANGSALAMDELGIVHANGLLNQKMDSELAGQWAEKAWQRRKITGETHPDVDRRLRFFGIDTDDL